MGWRLSRDLKGTDTMHISEKEWTIAEGNLQFRCPRCFSVSNPLQTAYAQEKRYVATLAGIFPLLSFNRTYLDCSACNTSFVSSMSYDDLVAIPVYEVHRHLRFRASVGGIMFVIFGYAALIFPWLDLGCFLPAFLLLRSSKSNWRTAAVIGLTLSTIWSAVAVIGICLGK